jgi:hypothetical protein
MNSALASGLWTRRPHPAVEFGDRNRLSQPVVRSGGQIRWSHPVVASGGAASGGWRIGRAHRAGASGGRIGRAHRAVASGGRIRRSRPGVEFGGRTWRSNSAVASGGGNRRSHPTSTSGVHVSITRSQSYAFGVRLRHSKPAPEVDTGVVHLQQPPATATRNCNPGLRTDEYTPRLLAVGVKRNSRPKHGITPSTPHPSGRA